jgi:hypothetical protein
MRELGDFQAFWADKMGSMASYRFFEKTVYSTDFLTDWDSIPEILIDRNYRNFYHLSIIEKRYQGGFLTMFYLCGKMRF